MRIVTFDGVLNLAPGQLFAVWGEFGMASPVLVVGPNGPQGQLMVRDLFEIDRPNMQSLHEGNTGVLRSEGFSWLQGHTEDQFVVFENRDLARILPQLSRVAAGFEIIYQGGSLDGLIDWVEHLTEEIRSDDQTTTPEPTAGVYVNTGEVTAEGYHVFRLNERRSRESGS